MMMSVLSFVATPSNFLMLLLLTGLCLSLLRKRGLGLSVIGLGALGLLTFGYTSASDFLLAPLVTRFPPVAVGDAPEPFGIVLVGSGIHEVHAAHTGALMELAEDGDGIPITALLARRFPQAHIIVSAGSLMSAPLRPADGIRRVLMEFGVAPDRIVMETEAQSTFEHARNSIALIGENANQTWWVISSAHRMPRLIGAFRQQGVNPIAYSVDFRWIAPFDPFYTYRFTEGLQMTDIAVKEWLGLAVYWRQGKTAVYFPAP